MDQNMTEQNGEHMVCCHCGIFFLAGRRVGIFHGNGKLHRTSTFWESLARLANIVKILFLTLFDKMPITKICLEFCSTKVSNLIICSCWQLEIVIFPNQGVHFSCSNGKPNLYILKKKNISTDHNFNLSLSESYHMGKNIAKLDFKTKKCFLTRAWIQN